MGVRFVCIGADGAESGCDVCVYCMGRRVGAIFACTVAESVAMFVCVYGGRGSVRQ